MFFIRCLILPMNASVFWYKKTFSNILKSTFSNICCLNFGSIDNHSPIDRFCVDILPRVRDNVKYLILKPILMERILLATDYPNLTHLKIVNFKQETVLCHLTSK